MSRKPLIIVGAFVLATAILYFAFQPVENNQAWQMSQTVQNSAAQITPASASDAGEKSATSSGKLQIEDLNVGTGPAVKSGDMVTVNYTGTLPDGTKFDSSYDSGKPFTTQIGVGRVIKGWDEGIIGMKVGGKRKLVIPPDLGYGDRTTGKIPPNSTLIFEVELLAIK